LEVTEDVRGVATRSLAIPTLELAKPLLQLTEPLFKLTKGLRCIATERELLLKLPPVTEESGLLAGLVTLTAWPEGEVLPLPVTI
jgi:hypothetical protein